MLRTELSDALYRTDPIINRIKKLRRKAELFVVCFSFYDCFSSMRGRYSLYSVSYAQE